MSNLNRRIFLRGLGGALVAAPFLGSLFERSAKAKSVPPAKRTILMFTHYGCITNKWFPAKLDGELTAADLEPTTLAPLAPFASKLLMPRGIRSMNEWTVNNTGPGNGRGQGNDIHTQIVGSALTCQPVTPNSNDPFSFEQETKFNAMPIGPSLDHVIAQQLSADGTPLLMNTAGQVTENAQSAISYAAREQLFPAVTAVEAFSKLTGLFDAGPQGPDTWAVAKGKALSDIVQDDLKRLKRLDMSKADREKLEVWEALSNQVSALIAVSACNQEAADSLGASSAPGTGEGDALTRKINDTMDNADLYSAVAALAALCNAAPIIVLKYPGNFVFSGLGINSDSDNLAHRLDHAGMQGPCVENVVEKLLTIDAYYAKKFANLVGYLDSLPEDEGTVLDNTVAVWMNDCSDGVARNLNNAPIIQAGSGGGYFKTGKVIDLDSSSGATAEQMLGRSLSQCYEGTTQEVDAISQATGTEARFGNAPVNKYFCSIMNAMGLKADDAGYPAKDGRGSEVTHFGYSDRTEDFCGGEGAVEGATIHDPGAFTELKA
jgi:hypothetical protein